MTKMQNICTTTFVAPTLLLAICLWCFPAQALDVSSLTCNDRLNPLGLDKTPLLSWRLSSDKQGEAQIAYHLQIASTLGQLNANADLYDSGKKISEQSTYVKVPQLTLITAKRYYWRVRVWGQQDIADWSEPAWFEMGLLKPSDWQADWITAPKLFDWATVDRRRKQIAKDAAPEQPEPAPLFRREFALNRKVAQARAFICGLGYHELYINGTKAGDHLLDPAFTRYDRRALYVTHDITPLVNQGDNAIGIMLANGWYNMRARDVWAYDHAVWRDEPVVKCQIQVTFEDGSKTTLSTDSSWTCSPGPILLSCVRQGEWYDARREQPGWARTGFNDNTWSPVRKSRGPEGQISAQTIPPVKIHHTAKPKSITRIAQGHYLVDFGQNMAGFVALNVNGQSGDEVAIKYAEKIKAGRADQSNIDTFVANTPFETDRYILKGGAQERWHARFTYHGFQYVEITGFPGTLTANSVTAHAVSTAFEQHSTFECSNPLINQIQHNTLWSYRNNFVGLPTDCPQREKNGWTGDASLAAEAGLFNFAAQPAYKKWMQDIADEQQNSGEIAAIIPTAGWGYYWGNGPAWDSAFILIPYYMYLYTGDVSTIATHYDQMKRYVDFLTREKQTNHLVSWGLGDWCYETTVTPATLTSTAYYYVDAMLISKFAGLLGKPQDARQYAALAQSIRTAFLEEFVDVTKGTVGNNSQTALSCALYQGLLAPEDAGKFVQSLVNNIAKNNHKLDFGILGAKYTLNALSQTGHANTAYALVNHTDYPGWGHWVEQGATTLWEDWKGASSLNHVMFGDVSAWFYKNIIGIQPDPERPGFKHFFVRPFFPKDMTWAKAKVGSPYGPIHCQWTREQDTINFTLQIPVNSSATVELPASASETVTLDKRGIGNDETITSLNGKAIYTLPSGWYSFTIHK